MAWEWEPPPRRARQAASLEWPDEVTIEPVDHALHADHDVICPNCLRFIQPHEDVRRSAWGLLQHEWCRYGER